MTAKQPRRMPLQIGLSSAASCVQGAPQYDYPSSTLILNITVISDPSVLKFSDGIARQTYQNALNPNQFAKVRSAAQLHQRRCVVAGLFSRHSHGCGDPPVCAGAFSLRSLVG